MTIKKNMILVERILQVTCHKTSFDKTQHITRRRGSFIKVPSVQRGYKIGKDETLEQKNLSPLVNQ